MDIPFTVGDNRPRLELAFEEQAKFRELKEEEAKEPLFASGCQSVEETHKGN